MVFVGHEPKKLPRSLRVVLRELIAPSGSSCRKSLPDLSKNGQADLICRRTGMTTEERPVFSCRPSNTLRRLMLILTLHQKVRFVRCGPLLTQCARSKPHLLIFCATCSVGRTPNA